MDDYIEQDPMGGGGDGVHYNPGNNNVDPENMAGGEYAPSNVDE